MTEVPTGHTELKQMSQTESNGSDTGFLLDSYWSITITDMIYLTTLINLHSPSIFKKSVMLVVVEVSDLVYCAFIALCSPSAQSLTMVHVV